MERSSNPQETLLSTSIAGATAAAVEAFTTYPLEYYKTRKQLVRGSNYNPPPPGKIYFKGCSALVVGNSAKAFMRYSVYNAASKFMSDPNGQTSAPFIVVAGMFTGLCESLLVVPFESIKTTMIERSMLGRKDPLFSTTAKSSTPKITTTASREQVQHNTAQGKPVRPIRPPAPSAKGVSQELKPGIESFSANVRDMYNTRGVRAFVQGFSPTLLRQVSNSVVRFTTYNFLKQAINPNSNEPLSSYLSFALGITAGAVEVVATQPIDVIKTRMQSSNARSLYRSSMMCSYKIFTEEGPTKLWTGMTPRFIKVSFSGGIVFTVYEITNKLVSHAMSENPFAPE